MKASFLGLDAAELKRNLKSYVHETEKGDTDIARLLSVQRHSVGKKNEAVNPRCHSVAVQNTSVQLKVQTGAALDHTSCYACFS